MATNEAEGTAGGYELAAVLAAGSLHVIVELWFSLGVARIFNACVVVAFGAYLLWQARRHPGRARAWGMRRDNFGAALAAQAGFGVVAAVALIGWAASRGPIELPGSMWASLLLYPAWGIAQQFALQNLLTRNLTPWIGSATALAAVSGIIFGLSHLPRADLALLASAAGFGLTRVYRSHPNLWAAGLVHGWLGSLAFALKLV